MNCCECNENDIASRFARWTIPVNEACRMEYYITNN